MNNKITCECGVSYRAKDKSRHEKSKGHLKFISPPNPEPVEDIYENDSVVISSIGDDDILNDLNRDVYEQMIENEEARIQQEKIQDKLNKENEKIMRKVKSKVVKDDISVASNDLFSAKPTEILGRDKRVLLAKVRNYKVLFPDELKAFKIKKNPSVDDLVNAIAEMDAIIATNGVQSFVMDGILQSLKVIEGASSQTNYNISGLSDILRNNPQFHHLSKQLFLKYGTFSRVEPEYQMMFLIFTTAYICRQRNNGRQQMNAYLDEPANIQHQNNNI